MSAEIKIIKKDSQKLAACDTLADVDGKREVSKAELQQTISNLRAALINTTRQLEKLETLLPLIT